MRTGGLVTRVSGVVVGLTVAVAILAIAFALPAARSKPHDLIAVLIWWAVGGAILVGIAALRTTAHRRHAARHFGEPAVWLGAGAITLGIGAALAGGSSVAHWCTIVRSVILDGLPMHPRCR